MASQARTDLVKIGMEGFALLDEYYGRSRRPSIHHRSQVPKKQPEIMTIVSKIPAVVSNGGTLVTNFTNEKANLVKAGLEGFALLEEYYGRPRKAERQYFHLGSHQVSKKQPDINSKMAAEIYGGVIITEFKANRYGTGLKY
ncbi:hypothetical protein CMV_006400 [Castanea mollissima]|uniref:Uncharacterized protein n=1 Tax=Castanea mollissima TaxID=60419 RepID=A0A8J4RQZ6_9ROSI|nr:hypothetical protein CMV_006400 [Castanea mollissima]